MRCFTTSQCTFCLKYCQLIIFISMYLSHIIISFITGSLYLYVKYLILFSHSFPLPSILFPLPIYKSFIFIFPSILYFFKKISFPFLPFLFPCSSFYLRMFFLLLNSYPPFCFLFTFWVYHIRETMQYLSLCVPFISYKIVVSRCIHLPKNDSCLSFFMAE